MFNKLAKNRNFNVLLIASFVFAILLVPMTAQAGILGSVLNAVRPFAKIAGNIAGAVAGASLGAAFMPPLGMLAGGVAGWIVGGIVTSYATGSLSNMAVLGGAALGVMALASFGPVGYVAGALVGGLLGKIAMNLLYKADRTATGGILFMTGDSQPAAANVQGVALAPEIPTSYDNAAQAPTISSEPVNNAVSISASPADIARADGDYRAAYQTYLSATREGNAQKINEAHKAYQAAFENYKKLTGKEPQ